MPPQSTIDHWRGKASGAALRGAARRGAAAEWQPRFRAATQSFRSRCRRVELPTKTSIYALPACAAAAAAVLFLYARSMRLSSCRTVLSGSVIRRPAYKLAASHRYLRRQPVMPIRGSVHGRGSRRSQPGRSVPASGHLIASWVVQPLCVLRSGCASFVAGRRRRKPLWRATLCHILLHLLA